MRDVYGASYSLRSGEFEEIRSRVLSWCLSRLATEPDSKADGRIEAPDGSWAEWAEFNSSVGTGRAWTCTFRHPDSTDPTLAWQSTATVASDGRTLRFTLRVGQDSLDPLLRPTMEAVGRPRIVRDLVGEFGAEADGVGLSVEPRVVASDDVRELVGLLADEARSLPVVVLTVAEDTGRPSADPRRIASELVGIAHTAVLATVPASYALTDAVGKRVSVFNGAVRIYWPGFTVDADPYSHRLYLRRTVEQIDARTTRGSRPAGMADQLVHLLGDVGALRVVPDPLVALCAAN